MNKFNKISQSKTILQPLAVIFSFMLCASFNILLLITWLVWCGFAKINRRVSIQTVQLSDRWKRSYCLFPKLNRLILFFRKFSSNHIKKKHTHNLTPRTIDIPAKKICGSLPSVINKIIRSTAVSAYTLLLQHSAGCLLGPTRET